MHWGCYIFVNQVNISHQDLLEFVTNDMSAIGPNWYVNSVFCTLFVWVLYYGFMDDNSWANQTVEYNGIWLACTLLALATGCCKDLEKGSRVLSLQTLPSRADTESEQRCGTEWGWLARQWKHLDTVVISATKQLVQTQLSTYIYCGGVFSGRASSLLASPRLTASVHTIYGLVRQN